MRFSPKWREDFGRILPVFLIYSLVIIVMTWPVVRDLSTQLIGGHVDQWTHLWTFHTVKENIFNNPYFANDIFYPIGVSLATHNIAWLNILLWLPLQAIIGEIAAYNVVFMLILTLNGTAIYLLAEEQTKSQLAAFIGGLIFTIFPYTLSHHDHANMIFITWLPLILLSLKRALETSNRRAVWLATLFIVLTSLARLHLLIMGSFLVAFYALYLLAQNYSRQNLQRLLWIGLISGVMTIVIASPILFSQITGSNPEDIFLDQQETHQTDLLSYVFPSFYHPLIQRDTIPEWVQIYAIPESIDPRTPFLGYTTIILVLYGLVMHRGRNWFWGLTAVFYILIALGPILRINNELFSDIFMPYRLIEDIYFIRILRQPHRFNIILSIPLAILAAQGAQIGLQRLKQKRHMVMATVVICGIILFEYMPIPYPHTSYTTPAWLTDLADDPDDYAILNVPFAIFSHNKRHMFDQITHGKPIVNGKVARVPREALAFIDSSPFLKAVADDADFTKEQAVSEQLRLLAEANVRYLVIHKDLLSTTDLINWREWIVIEPTYEDETLVVYLTTPQAGRDFHIEQPLTDELALMSAGSSGAAKQGEWLTIDTAWASAQPIEDDLTVCLDLIQPTSDSKERYCQPLSEAQPTSSWQSNEIVHSSYQVQINPFFAPGEYQIFLHLFNGEQQITTQPRLVGDLSVSQIERQFSPSSPEAVTAVTWDEQIVLSGYDYEGEATSDQLAVTLHWTTKQRLENSYKMFLHLLDEDGNLVSQIDYVPQNWTYPTNWWEAGEYVVDTAVLPLESIGSGTYQLQIGIYDPESGERLLASSDNAGDLVDVVVLTEIIRP